MVLRLLKNGGQNNNMDLVEAAKRVFGVAKDTWDYGKMKASRKNPYEQDIIGPATRRYEQEVKPFTDKGLQKNPEGTWTSMKQEKIPTPPLRPPTSTPYPTSSPTPTASPDSGRGRNPNTTKVTIGQDVYDAINTAANTYGVPPQLLFDVAMAESTFNPKAKAYDPKSTSSGLFMFNNGTWQEAQKLVPNLPDANRWNPLSSSLAAAWYIKNRLLGRWNASKDSKDNKNSWGQFWDDQELQDYYPENLTKDLAQQ